MEKRLTEDDRFRLAEIVRPTFREGMSAAARLWEIETVAGPDRCGVEAVDRLKDAADAFEAVARALAEIRGEAPLMDSVAASEVCDGLADRLTLAVREGAQRLASLAENATRAKRAA